MIESFKKFVQAALPGNPARLLMVAALASYPGSLEDGDTQSPSSLQNNPSVQDVDPVGFRDQLNRVLSSDTASETETPVALDLSERERIDFDEAFKADLRKFFPGCDSFEHPNILLATAPNGSPAAITFVAARYFESAYPQYTVELRVGAVGDNILQSFTGESAGEMARAIKAQVSLGCP